jgi:hypothetical protein
MASASGILFDDLTKNVRRKVFILPLSEFLNFVEHDDQKLHILYAVTFPLKQINKIIVIVFQQIPMFFNRSRLYNITKSPGICDGNNIPYHVNFPLSR